MSLRNTLEDVMSLYHVRRRIIECLGHVSEAGALAVMLPNYDCTKKERITLKLAAPDILIVKLRAYRRKAWHVPPKMYGPRDGPSDGIYRQIIGRVYRSERMFGMRWTCCDIDNISNLLENHRGMFGGDVHDMYGLLLFCLRYVTSGYDLRVQLRLNSLLREAFRDIKAIRWIYSKLPKEHCHGHNILATAASAHITNEWRGNIISWRKEKYAFLIPEFAKRDAEVLVQHLLAGHEIPLAFTCDWISTQERSFDELVAYAEKCTSGWQRELVLGLHASRIPRGIKGILAEKLVMGNRHAILEHACHMPPSRAIAFIGEAPLCIVTEVFQHLTKATTPSTSTRRSRIDFERYAKKQARLGNPYAYYPLAALTSLRTSLEEYGGEVDTENAAHIQEVLMHTARMVRSWKKDNTNMDVWTRARDLLYDNAIYITAKLGLEEKVVHEMRRIMTCM